MKPEEWKTLSTPDPDMVLRCRVRLERDAMGLWYARIGEDLQYYHGPARAVIMEIMRDARQRYPDVPSWLLPADDITMPGLRDLGPDPQLAALLQKEEEISAVFVCFDIYVRDGRGVGVGVGQNSILVRERPPKPTMEEFPSAAVMPLPRPRFAWLFALADTVIHRGSFMVGLTCCAAAGAGLYRQDASAVAWLVLAVAVELLHPELRRILYEFGSKDV